MKEWKNMKNRWIAILVISILAIFPGVSTFMMVPKAEAKAAKDKAKAKSKETGKKSTNTGTAETTVVIGKGSSTPGCDNTNSCFTPNAAKVSIGGKVTWRNDDTASHTAISGTDAIADGIFDSGLFGPGKTFSFKFDKAGTYNYYCQVHPWMKGSVIVS